MPVGFKYGHVSTNLRKDEQCGQLRDAGNRCNPFDLSVILTASEKELCFNLINGFVDEINMGFCMGHFEFLFFQDMVSVDSIHDFVFGSFYPVVDQRTTYAAGKEVGVGSWLQIAVGKKEQTTIYYDDFVPETEATDTFCESEGIEVEFPEGDNVLRLMNHRRQENTLDSYAALLGELNIAKPNHDIILSICESPNGSLFRSTSTPGLEGV